MLFQHNPIKCNIPVNISFHTFERKHLQNVLEIGGLLLRYINTYIIVRYKVISVKRSVYR